MQGKQPKRCHCFAPMSRDHRRIVHELAEVYGVVSVSYESEPKRNVVITAIRCEPLQRSPNMCILFRVREAQSITIQMF